MPVMQEQLNDKAVAISIKGAKLTARLLAMAMQAFLKKAREPTFKHGKQSLKTLTKQGASLANAELSGDDVGSFKRVARKYNIDFAIKRDVSAKEPKIIVFFKARDVKALESAFNEYSKLVVPRKSKKPSLLAKLAKFKELAQSPLTPAKNRKRGGHEL